MNVNTSDKDRESAPAWGVSWGRTWNKRDKHQFEQTVVRCERCASNKFRAPDRGFWQYAYPTTRPGISLVLECGHFVKVGAPAPQEA